MSRLAIVACAALVLLPGLGRMGALDSTDARYLAVAREMARSGEWIVPRLGGAPHLDKPPLAYWASALGERVAGAGERGGRLYQPLALAASALALAAAARQLAGPQWALPAALALVTALLPFALSRGAQADLLQLACVTPALALLHGARQRGSRVHAALAGALLGVAMWAKGPIGALVVAAVWLGARLACAAPARLPRSGVALGIALFAAIGLPWYALVEARVPGVAAWWASQLGERVTGEGAGHVKDATYTLRAWLLGLLPWTPIALLALWRLRPCGGRRSADPGDAFALAWSLAPVALFSLFATQLAPYVLPALPGAILVVARAGARGRLDDRRARVTLAASFAATAVLALAAGAALLAGSRLGIDVFAHVDANAAAVALLGIGALGVARVRRVAALAPERALLATAILSGALLATGFQAVARALPTLREEAGIVRGVPGARLVAFSFQPSLFYYAEPDVTVYVAGVRGLVEPFVSAEDAQRLTRTRADALAMLREDAPTFAWIDAWQAEDLAALAGTRELRRSGKYALVANPAALRALAETGALR